MDELKGSKVLKGIEKGPLNTEREKYMKDFELKAFYIGDFVNAQDETIGDFLFNYDKEKEMFTLPANNEIQYEFKTVLMDEDFLIVLIDK